MINTFSGKALNPMAQIDLAHVSAVLKRFTRTDLGGTLSGIESAVKGLTAASCAKTLSTAGVTSEVLSAAASLKRLAGQVNVAIHATGILLCLPHILEAEEIIEYVSLGAGNTGREFDLETNRRIAEFKFIHWRGGAESIRQNLLFKDFYLLAESKSSKRKYLYVLIVPWADCDDAQRLDVHNGLLLSALWDAAFDRGLISFADDGTVLASAQLSETARTVLALNGAPHLPGLRDAHQKNLALHRTCNGFG
jgi:hypothetical protein